jgi:hypothetical protein
VAIDATGERVRLVELPVVPVGDEHDSDMTSDKRMETFLSTEV